MRAAENVQQRALERRPGECPVERPGLTYVVNALHPGGTEKLILEMSYAFAREFQVSVVCLDEPGLWASELRARGIAVHCLWRQPGLDLSMVPRLAKQFRKCGAVIVHAHQCTPWFYAALSRLLYGRPKLLLEEHGRFYPEPDRPLRRFVNRSLVRRLTHRFVAVSDDIRGRLGRYEGLDSSRIEVIYNGVRSDAPLNSREREILRREWGFGAEDFVVGSVGRFDPIKNLPMLVQSIAAVRLVEPRVRGLLIGDGPELPSIRSLIEHLGLADEVRLAGFREDARRLVQCVDLFVLSSFSEGTSVALLEAMAAGLPVAVTAVGGNPEIVVAGETGWIVPSGVMESLTRAIVEAAADPQKCQRFGEAGRRRFGERFTLDAMVASYRRIYRTLMSQMS
jgi:L-malate glycosyltransferase